MVLTLLRRFILIVCCTLFCGSSIASSQCAGSIKAVKQATNSLILALDNYDKYDYINQQYQLVVKYCSDPIDYYSTSTQVNALRISTGLDLITAETELLAYNSWLSGLNIEYNSHDYLTNTNLLMALYTKLGKPHLADIYARKVITLAKSYSVSDELIYDAYSVFGLSKYNEQLEADINEINKKITKFRSLYPNTILSPYLVNARVNRSLRERLKRHEYKQIEQTLAKFSSWNVDDVYYISDQFIELLLIGELARAKQNKGLKYTARILRKSEDNAFFISYENRIKLLLLKLYSEKRGHKETLEQLNLVTEQMFSTYDDARAIASEFELQLLIEIVIQKFLKIQDVEMQHQLFRLAQIMDINNPINSDIQLSRVNHQFTEALSEKRKLKELVIQEQQDILSEDGSFQDLDQVIERIRRATQKIQTIEHRLRQDPNYRTIERKAIDVNALQDKLTSQEIFIYSTQIHRSVVTFYIAKSGLKMTLFNLEQLEELAREHRHNLEHHKDSTKTGKLLFDKILSEQVKATLGSIETIHVASYGLLSKIPFGTLYEQDWLVTQYKIQRYTGLAQFLVPYSQNSTLNTRLAIANPDYPLVEEVDEPTDAQVIIANLKQLPKSWDEAISLVGSDHESRESRVLLGQEKASEDNVRAMLKNSWDIVSFSTHTLFPGGNNFIRYPGLALTVDPDKTNTDGFYNTVEIAESKYSGSWLILAACDTAVASEIKGAFNSLLNAFILAGSKGVLATHWKIDNEEAAEFVILLSEHIDSTQMDFGEALLQSQRQLAKKYSNRANSASYWGAWEIFY